MAGWLGTHPQVFMSVPKEPGFLAFNNKGYPYRDGYGRPAPASRWVISDEANYLNLFAGASSDQVVLGEASTWYFSLPGMAQRLRNYNPEAKILVILRNPIERAYSAWSHARRDGLEPCERFHDALDREEERGEVEFLLRYHSMGLYSDALREYQATFDPSRFLLLWYEELHADERELWHRLCDFLAIDHLREVPAQRRLNRSGMPRSKLLQSLLRDHRVKRVARKLLPHALTTWSKDKLDDLNLRQLPGLDPATRAQLADYYRADITRLAELTGRNLDHWLLPE